MALADLSSESLPKEIKDAACANQVDIVATWLDENGARGLNAVSEVDLTPGATVKARFHGGGEWYDAVVVHQNDDNTFKLEYREPGEDTVWGEYDMCPREEITLSGATTGGETLLMLAAENNAIETVELLLSRGADLNVQRFNGDSALIAAVIRDFEQPARLLMERGCRLELQNNEGETALIKAAELGSNKALQAILASHRMTIQLLNDCTKEAHTAVSTAAYHNQLDSLQLLLAKGADRNIPTMSGDSPIMLTARFPSHIECSRALLSPSTDLSITNTNGDDVLTLSARAKNTDLVVLLSNCDMGVKVDPTHQNNKGDTAIMLAVAHGDVKGLHALLHMTGVDASIVNKQNNSGDTALTWAVWHNQSECLDVLLASGANVNVKTKKGETALMFAVFRNYPQVLSKLIQARADIEAVNENGDSAIHLAAGCANAPDCLEVLLTSRANINKQDLHGHTPLMLAVGQANVECVKVLMASPLVNTALRNVFGQSAYEFAQASQRAEEMLELISTNGVPSMPSDGMTPDYPAENLASSKGVIDGFGGLTVLEHFDETTGQWVYLDAETGHMIDKETGASIQQPATSQPVYETTATDHSFQQQQQQASMMTSPPPSHASSIRPPRRESTEDENGFFDGNQHSFNSDEYEDDPNTASIELQSGGEEGDHDMALAMQLQELERLHGVNETASTSRPRTHHVNTQRMHAPQQQQPVERQGELIAVNLCRPPSGGSFGLTITQRRNEVCIQTCHRRNGIIKPGDKLIAINDTNVERMLVHEVAQLVRRKANDKILSILVERPKKWAIERYFDRSERATEKSLHRFLFGGSYPRTLHLTIIGAASLPALPSGRWPSSFAEVQSTRASFLTRTTVVRNNAFPVWEQLVELPVLSPDDTITVQLFHEDLEGDQRGRASQSDNRLTGQLRIPHFDKRFCCGREVSLVMLPATTESYHPHDTRQPSKIVLRLRAHWEKSVDDVEIEHSRMERELRKSTAAVPPTLPTVRERMKCSLVGIKGLPTVTQRTPTSIIVRNWSTDQYLETKPFYSTAPLLDLDGSQSQAQDTLIHELFWVIMRSPEDKIEFLIVTHEGGDPSNPQTDEGDVIGYARMPHWDDRVMLGNEVGLRVRLGDEYGGSKRNECVLRITSEWHDKATAKDLSFPRTLLIHILDFAATNWGIDREDVDENSNLYVELLNASTGQVHRTKVQSGSRFPTFDEVFQIQAKSLFDRITLSVLNCSAMHQSGDEKLGSAELALQSKVVNKRAAALEISGMPAPGEHSGVTTGVLQFIACWEVETSSPDDERG